MNSTGMWILSCVCVCCVCTFVYVLCFVCACVKCLLCSIYVKCMRVYFHLDLAGPGMMDQHCIVEHIDGVVMLNPKQGECYVNYDQIIEPTKLNQGSNPEIITACLMCSRTCLSGHLYRETTS